MRTKGFCLALLRCGEIKLIAEKREYAISDLIANIARTKRRRTKYFGKQSSFTGGELGHSGDASPHKSHQIPLDKTGSGSIMDPPARGATA